MGRLDGKVAIVTGGAQGQGAGIVRAYVAEGARVVVADIAEEQGRAVAAELGAEAHFARHDVGDEASWTAVVEDANARFGPVSVLANNAGILRFGDIERMGSDEVELLWRINQLGCFLGMQAVVPAMERSGGGSIVNISSTAGLRGSPGAIAYSGTKWALRGMTKAAAVDLAPKQIRVNSVHPGPIDTDMVKVWSNEQRATRLSQIPIGRIGTAEDVARVVLFLLSDDSSYMTGAELSVDGGASL
jgi:3alpha(or 20beta)-hydroxysteroid dehydrogenase